MSLMPFLDSFLVRRRRRLIVQGVFLVVQAVSLVTLGVLGPMGADVGTLTVPFSVWGIAFSLESMLKIYALKFANEPVQDKAEPVA